MAITSQKELIEKLENGYFLEVVTRFSTSFYYITNKKDIEITVSKNVVENLKTKGIIDRNNDYKR